MPLPGERAVRVRVDHLLRAEARIPLEVELVAQEDGHEIADVDVDHGAVRGVDRRRTREHAERGEHRSQVDWFGSHATLKRRELSEISLFCALKFFGKLLETRKQPKQTASATLPSP